MNPKHIFWLSSSVAALGVGAAVMYFFMVYIPNRDLLQTKVAAENARATRLSQLDADCANRAKPATQQFLLEQRLLDSSVAFMGYSNHYNRRLEKCVVEVDTTSNGSYASSYSRYFVDAIENAILMSCATLHPHDRKSDSNFQCHDAYLVTIPPDQEDKRLKAIMTE